MVSWGDQEKEALKLSWEKGFGWQRFGGGGGATVHTAVKRQESMGFDYNLRFFRGIERDETEPKTLWSENKKYEMLGEGI